MTLAARVELRATSRASATALQILIYTQLIFAQSTHDSTLVALRQGPHDRLVLFESIVAADACVKLLAACVLDSDHIKCGVPVSALSQKCDRPAMHHRWRCVWCWCRHCRQRNELV